MLWEFTNFVIETVWSFWYIWIFIMMTIESSFIPFPSEVAMIPAWYLSSIWEMNIILAFLAWTFWALSWASINYFLWKKLGWPIIKSLVWKYWKYVFLSVSHYEQTEIFFKKHWWITTFNWRFIPAVRQLISIPAWVFKMDFKKFVLYTFIWAWIWNIILLSIWYIAWQNKELISNYSHIALIWVLVLIALVSVLYYFIDKHFLGKNK
mgnify:CR=1 FL=1